MGLFVSYRDGGKTDEQGLHRPIGKLFTDGLALAADADAFAVTQRGAGANMSVDVAPGDIHVPINDYGYWGWNDDVENVTIAAADVSNPRRDLIVAYVDLSVVDDTLSNNPGALVVEAVSGTPAGSPVDPDNTAIETAIGASNPYIVLARVQLPASATTVVDAYITDLREGITTLLDPLAKRVTTITSSGTITPNADTTDVYVVTALATAPTIGAPTGTPTTGQTLLIRIKDNGTARALTFNAIYRAIGVTLPTTTTISKLLYIGAVYNETDTKWDVIAIREEA